MARIDWVDRRLREWAQWLMVGDGSGYSAMNPLHPEWSPPTPGTTPTMKVAAPSSARQTNLVVRRLSDRLHATLLLHYCTNLSVADQAARLNCQAATVDQRIRTAHAKLARMLSEVLRN